MNERVARIDAGCSIYDDRGNKEDYLNSVVLIGTKVTHIDQDNITDLLRALERIENVTEWAQELVITSTIEEHQTYLRKATVMIFRNKRNLISVITKKIREKNGGKQHSGEQDRKMLIKTSDSTYAEMLRKLKQEVNIEETGVKIRKIRTIAKGDMVLAVEGGANMVMELEKEIRNKVDGAKITTDRKETMTIYIRGIDTISTMKEIQQVIVKETKLSVQILI